MSQSKDYTATFLVDTTPDAAFAAINNVRGWWSDTIEGSTHTLGEFKYRAGDVADIHRCTLRVTELVPGKKVVWHVVDNYFSFVPDKSEWTGTDIVFDIARKGDQTQVRFTHVGLVPAYECYNVCSDAWGHYITSSLRNLIATGKGQPNINREIVEKHGIGIEASGAHYSTTIVVDQTPAEAFAAINHVRGWWSGDVEGETDKLGAEFTYRVPDVHYSRLRIAEFVPGKTVVWQVLDSDLSYIETKNEWNDTSIRFDIAPTAGKTEVRFTHIGLVPAEECYTSCSDAWGSLIRGNLRQLIATGQDQPNLFASKETATQ